jgi:hypothetical protein
MINAGVSRTVSKLGDRSERKNCIFTVFYFDYFTLGGVGIVERAATFVAALILLDGGEFRDLLFEGGDPFGLGLLTGIDLCLLFFLEGGDIETGVLGHAGQE